MRKRNAFTLIELLLVISILVLLMAILLPALQKARKQVKAVMCRANLRQWGPVWLMYTEQNNSKFPWRSTQNLTGTNFAIDWRVELEDFYSNDRRILFCPMTTKTFEDGATQVKYAITVDSIWGRKSSYSANGWILNAFSIGRIRPGTYWGTPNVPNAYKVPVMGDSFWWYGCRPDPNDPPPTYDGEGPNASGLPSMRAFCIDRHDGAINVLFMDWSVRKVGLKELWTLKWHRSYDKAGPWTKAGSALPEDWPQWMRNFKDY